MLSELFLNNHLLIEREENRLLISPLGDETVVMDTDSGDYIGINAVGTSIWNLIQQPVTVQEILQSLISEYEVTEEQCLQEITIFLERLEELKLLKYSPLQS